MRIDDHILDWRIKAIGCKILSFLPFWKKVIDLVKKNIVKTLPWSLEPHLEDTFPEIYQAYVDYYLRGLTIPIDYFTYLEIGPGYHLVDSMMMYVGGWRVFLIDIDYMLDYYFMKEAFVTIKRKASHICNRLSNYSICPDKLEALSRIFEPQHRSKNEMVNALHDIGIEYCVIKDNNYDSFLDSHSIDIAAAHMVFEHIPKSSIKSVLFQIKKALKLEGLLYIHIDLRDHYHFYKNSNEYNYLRYSDFIWDNFFNNSLVFQNRLVADEYYKIFNDCDFKILSLDEIKSDSDQLEKLKKIKINKRYLSFQFERLQIRQIKALLRNG